MARPLRINYEGAWYHVMNRGIERRDVFLDDDDRRVFLRLLSDLEENFGVEVHAYCLMDNHYHLVVHTPKANLSRAMRWLGQLYSQAFNRRYGRVGPLFQGRFKSKPVDPDGWLLELSIYVHLNPLRVVRLGLGKLDDKRESQGFGDQPDIKAIDRRLRELRSYQWSSYRYYAGYRKPVKWLRTGKILGSCGRQGKGQRETYRRLVRQRLKRGTEESTIERIHDEVALGSAEFVEKITKRFRGAVKRETSVKRRMSRMLDLEAIISCVEKAKGAGRSEWLTRHGDEGKWMVLHLARYRTGKTLRELGEDFGGMDYVAVSMGIKRFKKKLETDLTMRKRFQRAERMLHVKMTLNPS